MKKNITNCLKRLHQSSFRRRFHLGEKERMICKSRGRETILLDCRHFIQTRLSQPERYGFQEGKQTPWKGHPVFVAQHATATCCRQCLQRWYNINKHSPLTEEEMTFIKELIMEWIFREQKHYE